MKRLPRPKWMPARIQSRNSARQQPVWHPRLHLRELLADPSIDAVILSTPDHWHVPIAPCPPTPICPRIGTPTQRGQPEFAGFEADPHFTRLKLRVNELWIALDALLATRRLRLDASLSSSERTVRVFLQSLSMRSDEPWTLGAMAEECGIGRSSLARYCRQHTNCTPIEYLVRCRLDRACELLRMTGHSITDVR